MKTQYQNLDFGDESSNVVISIGDFYALQVMADMLQDSAADREEAAKHIKMTIDVIAEHNNIKPIHLAFGNKGDMRGEKIKQKQ
ncbi:MAG: hypothetical protein GC137_02515 [Alphaproteobacteria bacterium]|nr:hypothetical protein [Alphaproteobacteria bacterium]